jgi:hypothetical protein
MPAAPRIIKNVQVARELGSNVAITSSATTDVVTSAAHGLVAGDLIRIVGHTGSTPDINGTHYVASVPSSTTFTIGIDITVGGTGGILNKLNTGTTPAAAAVWRRLTGTIVMRRVVDLEEFSDIDVGVYADSLTPMVIAQACEFEWEFKLDFDQLLLCLLSGVKADVLPVATSGTQVWTFTPGAATPAKVDSYTWEFNETDGASNLITRSNFVVCTGFKITIGDNGIPTVRATFLGRAPVNATAFTATTPGAVPTLDGKHAAARKWKAFADASWAALGTTQLGLGQLYGMEYTFGPYVNPEYFLDGRADLDHSILVSQRRQIALLMDVLVDPAPTSFVATEQVNKPLGTKRFIQAEVIGAVLGSANYKLELDGAYKHVSDSLVERGNDRNGNLMTRASFKNIYDNTGAADSRIVLVNGLTVFP